MCSRFTAGRIARGAHLSCFCHPEEHNAGPGVRGKEIRYPVVASPACGSVATLGSAKPQTGLQELREGRRASAYGWVRGVGSGRMSTQDPTLRVFVSHVHAEAAIAAVLKDWLEDAFRGRIAVFVSSDIKENPGGREWMARVKAELTNPQMRILLSLLSLQAVASPWVSVELGAAWVLDRGLFPLCHSGQLIDNLPRPIKDFGGANLDDEDAAKRLVGAVAQATSLRAPERWDFDGFLKALRDNATRLARPATAPAASTTASPSAKESALPLEQVALLKVLARALDMNSGDMTIERAASLTDLKNSVASYHLSTLVERGLARNLYYQRGRAFRISDEGTGWLIGNGQLPG